MSFTCSGNHKTRLFIGEGNFSFTEAFIRKHDEKAGHDASNSLAHSIISTDLVAKIHCATCDLISSFENQEISTSDSENAQEASTTPCDDCSSVISRIENLKSRGVKILLGVDATSLSTHEAFKEKKISRIHWNCPHDGSNFKDQTLPAIISDFFKECFKIQDPKGRIHITLAQPTGKRTFYQGFVYDISKAARMAGYSLIKKRKFEKDRYQGYQHTQTNSRSEASATGQGMREFVFEKVTKELFDEITEKAKEPKSGRILAEKRLKGLQQVSDKKCNINHSSFYNEVRFYYTCSSDEDSSDCEM